MNGCLVWMTEGGLAKGVILGDLVQVPAPRYTSSLVLKQTICAQGNKCNSIKELPMKSNSLSSSCLARFPSTGENSGVIWGKIMWRFLPLYYYLSSYITNFSEYQLIPRFENKHVSHTILLFQISIEIIAFYFLY